MVQPAATQSKPRTRKLQPPVTVRPRDVQAGLWLALSSDGTQWYMQDLREYSCTCPAGVQHFAHCKKGQCKHVIAARTIARALASMSPADRAIAERMQNIRVHVDQVDVAALAAPLHRPAAQVAPLAAAA
jgi:predicted nucleic acid-binding Zn finger protein